MKLIRWGEPYREKPGVVLQDQYYDTSAFGEDYDERFFGTEGLSRLRAFVEQHPLPRVPEGARLGPPVARPSKIICIGLNYTDHAKETGAALPAEPIIFFKSTTALSGPFDDIVIPKNSTKTDWEVELAFVIGSKAQYVDEQQASGHVAGYCLHNDLSERAFQLERNGQWVKGKSCDTFAPMGPFLVTPEEVENVHDLSIWLKLNGETVQQSTTAHMIFKIPFLVSYVSQFMTLLPGDIISTGTPAGVGLGMNPPRYLKSGDTVELGITGLGSSRQQVVPYAP